MVRYSKVIAAAALLLSSVTVAVAADLPARQIAPVAPVAPQPTFTFGGYYAGVTGGYGVASGKAHGWSITAPFGGGDKSAGKSLGGAKTDGGFVGGGQLGYNVQQGALVIGLETDLNYANLSLAGRRAASPGAVAAAHTRVNWFGTVRPRIGFVPMERLMIYGTGGLAYGSVASARSGAVAGLGASASRSDFRAGYTLGAGIEYAVSDNLTLRGSYDYVDLGRGGAARRSKLATATYGAVAGPSDRARFQLFRAGLNYRF